MNNQASAMTKESGGERPETESNASKRSSSGEAAVGYATLGCLVAGTVGVVKGLATGGVESGICLLAAVAAFGTVCYVYFHKS